MIEAWIKRYVILMEEVAGEGKPQILKIVPPLLPWVAASFI